ncbi:hypothetical protein BDY19DRAFT_977022 [Irpex rosettiformis]|uniref:Uncharacterized protein n=1 Tax=Irpex rosettiformis TaxID=378272 RepID=A0ACB8TNM9_9APHY|nr:hypothetical protein BDY19DRAFT_977022 [Irpex rosettiformis]
MTLRTSGCPTTCAQISHKHRENAGQREIAAVYIEHVKAGQRAPVACALVLIT